MQIQSCAPGACAAQQVCGFPFSKPPCLHTQYGPCSTHCGTVTRPPYYYGTRLIAVFCVSASSSLARLSALLYAILLRFYRAGAPLPPVKGCEPASTASLIPPSQGVSRA